MDFHYKKDKDLSLAKALSLEWLETNGLGGYASSTILNCHTRKYHGLLVACLDNPWGKYVLLSKTDDIFVFKGTEQSLTSHQYGPTLHDGSFDFLQDFSLTTHPTFIYQFADIILSKEILMLHEENTVLIKYKLWHCPNNALAKIILKPLLACRDFHALTKENPFLQTQVQSCLNGKKITPYQGLPTLFLQTDSSNSEFITGPNWYKDFTYQVEKERGFDYREDLFTPGAFKFEFNKHQEVIFACSLQEQDTNLALKWEQELDRRAQYNKKIKAASLQRPLLKVAPSFLQKHPKTDQFGIIAGFHWFLEWGRDAMISLPGLTLYNGLEKECLNVLEYFSQHEKNGLIPNFIGKTPEESAYNSVDASLWFAWAVQQYYLETKDLKSIQDKLWPTLKNIFYHYRDGTLYGIGMNADGLINAGFKDSKLNLTWMDGMVNGMPVIKRDGLAVEVNALWYNLLGFMKELAKQFKDPLAKELGGLLTQIKAAFKKTFWDEKLGYLRDFVNPDDPHDPAGLALRPNQIFAVSLPYAPLSPKLMLKVVQAVHANLLTPYGLRSLAPSAITYVGHYGGGAEARDRAYHNGTVWPWLLGHFTEALIRVLKDKKAVRKILKPCLNALEEHLKEAGIGSISEIFSGDAPHEPNGCISQAWSVAEVIRLGYLLRD